MELLDSMLKVLFELSCPYIVICNSFVMLSGQKQREMMDNLDSGSVAKFLKAS